MAECLLRNVGIVIVTYESSGTIGATLSKLPLDKLGAVVVVDNASTDDTVSLAKAFQAVDVIINRTNVGFGRACNLGRRRIGPRLEWLLFLNPDCVISADGIRLLVEFLAVHPAVGLAGPRLRSAAGWLTSAGNEGSFLTELWSVIPPRFVRHLPQRRFDPLYDQEGSVGYVEGACMLFRSHAFDSVGGFDERYFLFYEELDLSRRLRRAGFATALVPRAIATHLRAVSRRSAPDRVRIEMLRSAALYIDRWYGIAAGTAFRSLALCHLVERTARRKVQAQLSWAMLRALGTPRRRSP